MHPVTRTARKVHRCDLCGRAIEPGSKYVTCNLPPDRDDPHWYTYMAHVECDAYYCTSDKWWDRPLPGPMGYGDEFLEYMQAWKAKEVWG